MTLTPRGFLFVSSVFVLGLVGGRYTTHISDYQAMLKLSLEQTQTCRDELNTSLVALRLTSDSLPGKVEERRKPLTRSKR